MSSASDQLLARVTDFFLSSSGYNGLPARSLEVAETKLLAQLVEGELVSIVFGDRHPNPHILALPPEPAKKQVDQLVASGVTNACLYPTRRYLEGVVDPGAYEGRPYTLLLALGEPQLDYRAFDLMILEIYRNDPRYAYQTDDVSGWISVGDAHFESDHMPESDQVLLQSFGFAYDEDLDRAVAVFLRDLAGLSQEHQQIWKARELTGDYELHPDYYRASILGEFPERMSIFDALLEEQRLLSRMSVAMGRAPLFRSVPDVRPRGFEFLIRPTLKEFQNFVNLLDKLISQNLDASFFGDDLERERLEAREDGALVSHPKGTLQLLEEWIGKTVHMPNREPIEESLAAFRKVRKLRQRPAHALDDDVFDQRYFVEQRVLMIEAYRGLRNLRLLFSNHPATRALEIPEWLKKPDIWTR